MKRLRIVLTRERDNLVAGDLVMTEALPDSDFDIFEINHWTVSWVGVTSVRFECEKGIVAPARESSGLG